MKRLTALALALGSFLLPVAFAQSPYEQPAEVYRPRSSSTPDLARDLTLAAIDLDTAAANLDDAAAAVPTYAQYRRRFETSDEYRKALADQRAAERRFSQVRDGVVATLHNDPKYKEILLNRQVMDARLQKLRDLGPDEEILPTAQAKLNYTTAAHHMEQAALADDAKARDARRDLDQANARVKSLKEIFNKTWTTDPAYVEATRSLYDAQNTYDQAARTYAGAAAAYEQAMIDREDQWDQALDVARNTYIGPRYWTPPLNWTTEAWSAGGTWPSNVAKAQPVAPPAEPPAAGQKSPALVER